MAHREVSVAICGAVVGIILGAGSLSFSQDVSLHGSSIDVIQSHQSADIPTQRDINRLIEEGKIGVTPREVSKIPTVKEEVEPKQEVKKEKPLTICSSVHEVLDAIAAAHTKFIPQNQEKFTELRANLASTVAQLRANKRYCSGKEDTATQEAVDEKSAVPGKDGCDKYELRSIRYTLCKLKSGTLNQ